jgi:hypothetical protein
MDMNGVRLRAALHVLDGKLVQQLVSAWTPRGGAKKSESDEMLDSEVKLGYMCIVCV